MFQRIYLLVACLSLALLAPLAPVAADDKPADKAAGSVAHIRLSGSLDETPVAVDPLFGSLGENFKAKIDRINKATTDKNVQALLIHVDGVSIGWAKVQELRKAIEAFRKTGKKTYAYFDSADSKDYLVAAACETVCIPEAGWLVLVGVRAEISFYKELFEKLGIRADFLQMGVYKFAAEPFTRSNMSPEARAQYKLVLDDFFENALVETISRSRQSKKTELSTDRVTKIIDDGPFTAKQAASLGLVDRVMYYEEVESLIKKELGAGVTIAKDYGSSKPADMDFTNPFNLFKLLASPKTGNFRAGKDRIALIYATGVITTGKGGQSLLGGQSIGSTTMVEAIKQAENDPKVKAIVLRVDSPGGSALASDLIWKELKNCKKPVIASMSDVAASGGYYISMGAKKVYAQPGTLTGSIGVVGGKIALGGLYDKVGITTESIARGANSAIFSSTHPFTATERKAMERLMEDIYDQFLTKVQANRAEAGKKFSRAEILKVAEGRIWTGRQALDKGLVDALGSLEDAVAEAKRQAGLSADTDTDYLILPKPRSFLDSLMEKGGDAQMFLPRDLTRMSELAPHLHTIDGLLELRCDPVWLMMPHGVQIK